MTINVGIAQTPNSTDLAKNFKSIFSLLDKFKLAEVDVVLFPECSLSGFSAKMKECTLEVVQPYLDQIQAWTDQTGIEVVLPTAIAENDRVYNSGRWFRGSENIPFYKIGLTDSEKKFFSVPDSPSPKVFEVRGFKFAVLICFEAEHQPWTYFGDGEVDAILWPGYWGWTLESGWSEEKEPGKPNLIFANVAQWKLPVLQSNFAFNDLEGYSGSGPEGLSFVIGRDNQLAMRGLHRQTGAIVVKLEKNSETTVISSCLQLD